MKDLNAFARVKKHFSNSLPIFSLIICILLTAAPNLHSQTISGSYTLARTPEQVQHLLELLQSQDRFLEVPECFFGRKVTFDAELADLLVFIDKTGSPASSGVPISSPAILQCLQQDSGVRFALLEGGKMREALFGEKFLYVLVFVAEKVGAKNSAAEAVPDVQTTEKIASKKLANGQVERTQEVSSEIKKKEPISVSQSSLDSKPGSGEFILYAMVRTIVNVFSGVAIEKGEKSDNVTDLVNTPVKMTLVGGSGDTQLYFGYIKAPLAENSLNRFTVHEDYAETKRVHLATFGNYSGSWITSSIGLLGTFMKSGKDERVPAEMFLLAHLYIKRPQLPAPHYQNQPLKRFFKQLSLSLVAGTKISSPLFDDLFFGVNVGHLFCGLGLVAGVNFRTQTLEGDKTKRKPHFSCGINIML